MGEGHRHGHRFTGEAELLRSPERIAVLEVERVVALSTEGLIPKNVLDVGAGTGVFAQAFALRGLQVVGVDTNPELLKIARTHVPSAQFQEGSAEDLGFTDGSFDVVFLGHLLHETGSPLDALQEARRVARSRVVVLEWPYRDEEYGPPLAHRLRPETIASLARDAGFQGVDRLCLEHMELYRLTP